MVINFPKLIRTSAAMHVYYQNGNMHAYFKRENKQVQRGLMKKKTIRALHIKYLVDPRECRSLDIIVGGVRRLDIYCFLLVATIRTVQNQYGVGPHYTYKYLMLNYKSTRDTSLWNKNLLSVKNILDHHFIVCRMFYVFIIKTSTGIRTLVRHVLQLETVVESQACTYSRQTRAYSSVIYN